MITKEELTDDLRALGVEEGMAIEVHSSLSELGVVEGGAAAVVAALMEAVGPEGALVMPSFLLSPPVGLDDEDRRMGVTTKIRILAPAFAGRTGMGAVADEFRGTPGVLTGEGTFRVSAWGRDAREHAKGLHRLHAIDGFALLVGVDIYSLSSMHYVEDALPQGIRERFGPTPEARARYPEREWLVETWRPSARPWLKIQAEAKARGLVREGLVGRAGSMFFKVNEVIGLYRRALETDPWGLYGLERPSGS